VLVTNPPGGAGGWPAGLVTAVTALLEVIDRVDEVWVPPEPLMQPARISANSALATRTAFRLFIRCFNFVVLAVFYNLAL
jgi:hypothetical protein